jgi:hypothetical protein
MTECSPREARAKAPGRREIVARFDGGDISSDGGVLLLGAVEERRRILERVSACFDDHRRPELIEHSVQELVSQRVLAIALGYEDVNDHEALRLDPLLATVAGKRDPKGKRRLRERDRGLGLASPATLGRLELSRSEEAATDRYKRIALDSTKLDDLLVTLFLEAHEEPPEEVILDVDATDDPIHGKQEGRFFHGYYDCYCYLPLYVFCGDHLLRARLRRSSIDGCEGGLEELEPIVERIRAAWPETRILLRGDSGFCREWIMAWCEARGVDYVLGMARNERLEKRIASDLQAAKDVHEATREPCRFFSDFQWTTRESWSRRRRVIAKAEHLAKGANPRFVVTSLGSEHEPKEVYEGIYCARGDMENRIKEQQLDLFADRTSCHEMAANQVRLYLSSVAYVLVSELRRLGLEGTEWARLQCGTIRTKLLKIGARVRVSVRKIWVSMSESCPYQDLFWLAWRKLQPT